MTRNQRETWETFTATWAVGCDVDRWVLFDGGGAVMATGTTCAGYDDQDKLVTMAGFVDAPAASL